MVALLLLAFNAIVVVGIQTGDGALQSRTPGIQAQGFQYVAAQGDPELLNNDVYDLSFVEGGEPLRGTGGHPLYSLDRDDWVRVRDLQVGERLHTAEGAVTVEALEKVRGVHRVYNLEVEGDHQYLIGEARVRAHNSKARPGTVTEGIYGFAEGGATYVGQSSNIPKRLQKHVKDGRFHDASKARTTEVLGGKTAREVAEHRRIQEITGNVPARKSSRVTNKKDPIGPNRRHLLEE